jgi:hypothetical protein
VLELEQGLQGFVTEFAFAASEQSSGPEKRTALAFGEPVGNWGFEQHSGG